MIDLVSYAQRSTDEQLMTRIDDTVDVELGTPVHALVLIIVSMINGGAGGTWATIVERLAIGDN